MVLEPMVTHASLSVIVFSFVVVHLFGLIQRGREPSASTARAIGAQTPKYAR